MDSTYWCWVFYTIAGADGLEGAAARGRRMRAPARQASGAGPASAGPVSASTGAACRRERRRSLLEAAWMGGGSPSGRSVGLAAQGPAAGGTTRAACKTGMGEGAAHGVQRAGPAWAEAHLVEDGCGDASRGSAMALISASRVRKEVLHTSISDLFPWLEFANPLYDLSGFLTLQQTRLENLLLVF
ncbi:unnamed protein product [Urochloa humidicola]